jgi:glycyl-tRNA synthetase beta chain
MQLLLEIGTEELPPGEIDGALEALALQLREGCTEERLALGEIKTFATPRRLALIVEDIDDSAEDLEELQVGPSVDIAFGDDGAPTRAAEGFARGKGVAVEDLKKVDTEKGEYVAALVHEEGRPASDILAEVLPAAIKNIPWKRSMRWGWGETPFARPITWLVALLDAEVIPFEFAGHETHRTTYGHRFMAPDPVELAYPSAYESALHDAHVIPDVDERKQVIRDGLRDAADELGLTVIDDEELISEVAQLVEWPVPLIGSFAERLLEVPREVLITSMKKHQRYFAFEDSDGNLANRFCFVSNIEAEDPDLVVAGNERVLVARLEDARFFWDEDRKQTLESRREKLHNIRYIEGLGSVAARTTRMAELSGWLVDELFDGDETLRDHAIRAAELSKADLASQMVYEFGDLQGTMGRYYALEDGEDDVVAHAIEEHYKPAGATDSVASSDCAAVVAIADKVDAICGCFALGLIPSGSADPYGLRRASIGLLRTLIEYDFELSLGKLLDRSYSLLPQGDIRARDVTCREAEAFISDRMRSLIDAPTDIANAVLEIRTDRLATLPQRASVLCDLRSDEDFEPLAAAFKRVVNILRKAEQDDETLGERLRSGELAVQASLLEDDAEKDLHKRLSEADERVGDAMEGADFQKAAEELIALKKPIDAFFDDVMVNVESSETRENRLALLHSIRRLFLQFADLSQIQVS